MLRSHRTNLAIKVALGGILVVLFISVVNMQLSLKELRERKAELAEQIADLRNDIEEIDYRLSEDVDAAYIERYMRKKGYRFPDEILFYNDIPN